MTQSPRVQKHDAHVEAWHVVELRRTLLNDLVSRYRRRGPEWMRRYVAGWRAWPGLREDFWKQVRGRK